MSDSTNSAKPPVTPTRRGRRPTRLSDEQLALVEKLAAIGSHLTTIAWRGAGVDPRTFAKLRERDPRVDLALERGAAEYHDTHVQVLNKAAAGGLWIPSLAVLKHKFGWREGDAGADARPQIVINMPGELSLEQYAQRIAARRTIEQQSEALPEPAPTKAKEAQRG